MKKKKLDNWDKWMKPSIESGKFISADAMMFFANPKMIFAQHKKNFRISFEGLDYSEVASDVCVRLYKNEGREITSADDFLKIVMREISNAIGRRKYWDKKLNHMVIGLDDVAYFPDKVFKEDHRETALDFAAVNKAIEKIYGKDFLTIINRQIDGYTTTEAVKHTRPSIKSGGYHFLEGKRNAINTERALRFLQRNFG